MDAEQITYARNHNLRWQDQFDFPMSWAFWRGLTHDNTGVDIGSNELSGQNIGVLLIRIEELERQVENAGMNGQVQYIVSLNKQLRDLEAKVERAFEKRGKRKEW